jgi:hypothetical protein
MHAIGLREGVRSVFGGNLLNDGLWIWLSKEKELLREDLVRTFLGCYISGCISWVDVVKVVTGSM